VSCASRAGYVAITYDILKIVAAGPMLLATSGVPLHSIGLREIVPRTKQIYRPRVDWRPPYRCQYQALRDDVWATYTRNVISVVDVAISAAENAPYQVYALVKSNRC